MYPFWDERKTRLSRKVIGINCDGSSSNVENKSVVATLEDGSTVYIIRGTIENNAVAGDNVIVRDETGETRMIPSSEVAGIVGEQNLDDLKQKAYDELEQEDRKTQSEINREVDLPLAGQGGFLIDGEGHRMEYHVLSVMNDEKGNPASVIVRSSENKDYMIPIGTFNTQRMMGRKYEAIKDYLDENDEEYHATEGAMNERYLLTSEEEEAKPSDNGGTADNTKPKPRVGYDYSVKVEDKDGNVIDGRISSTENGLLEVTFAKPFNGQTVARFTEEELNNVLQESHDADGNLVWSRKGESVLDDEAAPQDNAETPQGETAPQESNETETPQEEIPSGESVGTQDITQENVPQQGETQENATQGEEELSHRTALERIPRNENGEPIFEQAETPEDAWDALVEFSGGNAATAKEIADAMVEEKRKAYEKAQKLKLKGKTPTEMLASKQANAAELAKAESEYNHWLQMANVEKSRQNAIRNQKDQEEELQGNEPPASGEQNQTGTEPSERGGGTENAGSAEGEKGNLPPNEGREEIEENELDENGRPFIKAENGTTVFGEITDDSGLTAAPIKLSEGFQDANTGKGYGLLHIEANHGEQIRQAGFTSVKEFVSFVATHYDPDNIRVGKRRDDGSGTFLIQVTDTHDNTLFIELSKDGSYWNVNSGGIFRKGYSNKKETVAKTEPQQPTNAISSDSSLSANVKDGITNAEPNGEPTVSLDKGTTLPSESQTSVEKNSEKVVDSEGENTLQGKIDAASADVNTEPTDAQKEAGNYKKGHVQVGTFDITIEQPEGSIRRGTDADGKQWESKMHNTYGYFRGTEGVDGDHIDVFLSNNIDGWNGRKVFVVDQYNPDGTFDEHKVMLGFNDIDEAKSDYLANYEKGWENGRRIDVSATNLEDFEKWIASSHRKTKPFSEYSSVNKETMDNAPAKKPTLRKENQAKTSEEKTEGRKPSEKNEEGEPLKLIKGKKWESTSLPEKFKSNVRKGADSHDASWFVGKRRYGSTIAERDTINLLVEKFGSYIGVWNAYEEGKILLLGDEPALVKLCAAKEEESANASSDDANTQNKKASSTETKKPASRKKKPSTKKKTTEDKPQEQPKTKEKKNPGRLGLVSDERMEELKKRLRDKLNNLNAGIDPEIVAIGAELAAGYIDRGVVRIEEFAKALVKDLGDVARPYIKILYNSGREWIEAEDAEFASEMTPYEEVKKFDAANFDKAEDEHKGVFDAAEIRAKEQKTEEETKKKKKAKEKKTESKHDFTVSKKTEEVPPFDGKDSGLIIGKERRKNYVNPKDLVFYDKNNKDSTASGVFYENGYAVMTDGYLLTIIQQIYPQEYEGKIVKDGEFLNGKFPGYKAIIVSEAKPFNDTQTIIEEFEKIPKETDLVSMGGNLFDYKRSEQLIKLSKKVKDARLYIGYFRIYGNLLILKGDGVYAMLLSKSYTVENARNSQHLSVYDMDNQTYNTKESSEVISTRPHEENTGDNITSQTKGNDTSSTKTKKPASRKKESSSSPKTKGKDKPRLQKASEDKTVSEREAALRDMVIDRLRESGMDVVTDEEEGQRVLDEANGEERMSAKKKRALETVSVSQSEKHQQTVISSTLGANVLKKLDTLADEYTNSQKNKEKTFIGSVAQALGAERHGSASEYATFETKNGKVVTIRLANHNAKVSNFDNRDEQEGISIVVSAKENAGMTNDGNAHVVEYFYDAIDLRRAEGKPLADIVRSIKQALYSGEFKDTTGLAERQEVNANEVVRYNKVYHGSGADFDHFDHSHMGEGEGAQVFGWGTYVTEVEGIGRTYAEQNANYEPNDNDIEEAYANIAEKIEEHYGVEGGIEEVYGYGNGGFEVLDISRDKVHLAKWQEYFSEHEDEFDSWERNANDFNFDNEEDVDEFADIVERSINDYAIDVAEEEEIQNLLSGIQRHLYTVEIPDDTGKNYLDWDNEVPSSVDKESVIEKIVSLTSDGKDEFEMEMLENDVSDSIDEANTGEELYKAIAMYLGDKGTSNLLHDIGLTGIKYPADYLRGGREDGAKNYVIFNEADAKITDHVRFFRTSNGQAYGYTVGGKIYIDPRIANAETPIHEYAHLWATALRKGNPEQWNNVVGLMKGTDVWEEVKKTYPELKTDDEIADEVLAQYSGRRGAERLRKMQQEIAEGDGSVFEKAEKTGLLGRVREAIAKVWEWVGDFLHIKYERAEQVADQVMRDLWNGVDPRRIGVDEKVREQFIGEKGAERADHAEEANTRMENLGVAREMEKAGKDAKAVKMATGWERGADGKWRYEIPDGKYFKNGDAGFEKARARQSWSGELDKLEDRIFDGDELSEEENRRFEELAGKEAEFKAEFLKREKPHLADWLKNDELFKAYPELKGMGIVYAENTQGDVAGYYSRRDNQIVVNVNSSLDTESIIAHEVQHAIQDIEGFAKGGNTESIEREFQKAKAEWAARAYAHELEETAKELGEDYDQAAVEKALIKEYEDMDMSDWLPDKETRIKGFNYFARGYADRSLDDAIKQFRLKESPRADFNSYLEYRKLGGEVEARNVQSRMGMTPEERRASLAAETEDVAREDQIFLRGGSSDYSASERFASPTGMSRDEKAKRGDKLMNAPAVEVKGNQIVRTDGMSARQAAEKWWKENIGKPLLYNTEVGQVEINEKSIGSSLAHRYGQPKLDAITSLKDGFGNAVYLGTIADFTRTRDNVQNHYFAYPITYNGKRSYVFCRAMQDNNKNRLYVHEVFMADNIQNEGNTLQTAASKPHGGIALYKSILSDVLSDANVAKGNGTSKGAASENDDLFRRNEDNTHDATSNNEAKRKAVDKVSQKLHLGNVVVHETADGLGGYRATAKGWFDPRTGQIHIVLSNNADVSDVTKTILHEAVAHYGLRAMLGNERFSQLINSRIEKAPEEVREKIYSLMAKHGYDQSVAAEEYLASLAEEEAMSGAVKKFLANVRYMIYKLLEAVGIRDKERPTLSDNELKYMLWQSYRSRSNGEKSNYVFEAEKAAMEGRLGVGAFETDSDEGLLFRQDFEQQQKLQVRDEYERMINLESHKLMTAWVMTNFVKQEYMNSVAYQSFFNK